MMYDFIIIGGGIVGLAVAMELSTRYSKLKILVLEKESHLAFHQTGNNSGVIHSGIYYKPGSLKARLCRQGCTSMVNFCRDNDIEHEVCGKVIVATEEREIPLLRKLYSRGIENNINVSKIPSEKVKQIEPHVNCLEGIRVFSTGIVNYKQVCQKYAEIILNRGSEIKLNSKVSDIIKTREGLLIETSEDSYATKFVINCAGLYSDRVAKLDEVNPEAKIIPFRGEYYELKPDKRYLVKGLIYPVPNPNFPFLGVHFTRMIDGSVHAGPNAVLSFQREGYKKTDFDIGDFLDSILYPGFWKLVVKHKNEGFEEIIRSFSKAAFVRSLQKLIPEVQSQDLVPANSGVRAQALRSNGQLVDDFLLVRGKNSLHICNAPSPAATSSLEIGKAVVKEIADFI